MTTKENRVSADCILRGAKGELRDVLILGWDEDGGMFFNGNIQEGRDLIWLLETARTVLMANYLDDVT